MNLQNHSLRRKIRLNYSQPQASLNRINNQSTLSSNHSIQQLYQNSIMRNSFQLVKNFTKTIFTVFLFGLIIVSTYAQCDSSPISQQLYISETLSCTLKFDPCNNNKLIKCLKYQCVEDTQDCLSTMQTSSVSTCKQFCCQSYRNSINNDQQYSLKLCAQNLNNNDSSFQNKQSKSTSDGPTMILFFLVVIVFFAFVFFYFGKKQKQRNDHKNNDSAIPPTSVDLKGFSLQSDGPIFVNDNDKCAICQNNNVNLRAQCNHFYHAQCLVNWLKKSNKNPCPECQQVNYNPVKIYCKQCHTGDKLIKVQSTTSQRTIKIYDNHKCNNCKKIGSQSFALSEQGQAANGYTKDGYHKSKDVLNEQIQNETEQRSQNQYQAPNSARRKRKLQKLKKSQNKAKSQVDNQTVDQSQKQMNLNKPQSESEI